MKGKMKAVLKVLTCGAGFYVALHLPHAQAQLSAQSIQSIGGVQTAQPETIVTLAVGEAGLAQVAPADLPSGGTYYWILAGGGALPMPLPPQDGAAIYQVTPNVFIADQTGGQIITGPHRPGTQASNVSLASVAASQADSVMSLINQIQTQAATQQTRNMARAMGMDVPSPGDGGDGGGGGGGDYTNNYVVYTFDHSLLWLEITNVLNGWAYLNLHNGTNQIYAIWSTPNLLTPFAGWNVETEVWPTDTNCMPFTVATQSRTNLFLRAEDWTGVMQNGLYCWWTWKYFGNLSETATNVDSQGNLLGDDYTNGIDPNIISFTLAVTNNYVNSMSAPVQLNVTAGIPYYYAVTVDNTNYLAATNWQSYAGNNLAVNLGITEGWHDVWIGLRGLPANATQTWQWKRLKLDYTPPAIVITNPSVTTVSVPLVQIQGYSPEALASISYDLTNAAGLLTNQDAGITSQFYSTNTWELTTNYFECLDVPLTNGVNIITIHATDLAGNTTTTNISITLDYSGATNPVVQLAWPQNGMQICQGSFTLRGTVDDATAMIAATITDTNGNTTSLVGEVERTGVLWVENLPLAEGTNYLTLNVTNAAGYSSVTNISVVKSDMTLTLTKINGDLWLPTVNVSGLVSDSTAVVWANGIQGTNNGDGTWFAKNVPVSSSGVASFDLKAIPADGGDPDASTNLDKPDEVISPTSSARWTSTLLLPGDNSTIWTLNDCFCAYGVPATGDYNYIWTDDSSGGWSDRHYTYPASPGEGTFVTIADNDGVMSTNSGDADDQRWALDHSDITSLDDGALNRQTGQTTYQLRVGGKSTQGYIMQVSAGLTANQPDFLNIEPRYDVPSTNIVMGDFGALDDTGNAYKKVKGGEKHVITPSAAGKDYYKLNGLPGKQRHSLVSITEHTALTNTNLARTKVGVGEEVLLTGMPGNATWTTSAGGLSTNIGGGVTFTAPSNAPAGGVTATVIATVGSASIAIPFTVVPPSGETAVKYASDDTFSPGVYGAGMSIRATVQPADVSFYRVQMTEVAGPSTNIFGCFTNWPASVWYHWPANGAVGVTNSWTPLTGINSWLDHSSFSFPTLPPYSGGADLMIPMRWRIETNSNDNPFPSRFVTMRITDTSGSAIDTKLGLEAHRP
jgi:hypothetical protein